MRRTRTTLTIDRPMYCPKRGPANTLRNIDPGIANVTKLQRHSTESANRQQPTQHKSTSSTHDCGQSLTKCRRTKSQRVQPKSGHHDNAREQSVQHASHPQSVETASQLAPQPSMAGTGRTEWPSSQRWPRRTVLTQRWNLWELRGRESERERETK